jgi:hypothetical protein
MSSKWLDFAKSNCASRRIERFPGGCRGDR